MCGVAGIISDKNPEFNRERVQLMLNSLIHRGPDDEGIWQAEQVTLGHRRLSIIDLSKAGHQPMVNQSGYFCLTYNGEIYNYLELREELQKSGYEFQSHSDSEVILYAYEQWGADCVKRFNGMWAFAIWNTETRELFASRDRSGIKPFYYSRSGGEFIFASEIKALLEAGIEARENHAAIADYFCFRYVMGHKTFYKNIVQLEPGCSLTFKNERLSLQTYWHPGKLQNSTPPSEAGNRNLADELRILLEDSVKLRLRSDVPVGAYLSGGLDSSIVATLAARQSSGQISSFTASFDEGGIYDESRYAHDVVAKNGLKGYDLKPHSEEFWDDLSRVIYHLDQPFEGPQIHPKFQIAGLAAQKVKVCLGGQGGDEVFVGYPRYLMAFLEQALSSPEQRNFEMFRSWYGLTSLRSKARFLLKDRGEKDLTSRFLRFAAVTQAEQWQKMFTPDFLNKLDGYSPYDNYRNSFVSDGDDLARLQRYELKTFMQDLLQVEDRVSMAWSMESRLPLLDYRLIEFAMRLSPLDRTDGFKLKGLLKKSMRDILPESIVNRRDKLGFPTPFSKWATGGLRNKIDEHLGSDSHLLKRNIISKTFMNELKEKKNLSDMAGLNLWCAVSTETWFKVFFENSYKNYMVSS